ncbi:nitrate/sulfonate/bicarbonate transporter ATP-binding protein [Ameyamaea chiangmaiensis NBRC 103196]|uniref:ATP-binding cassette domain-containing protein n=1 Tax=Ameyamaea chiangmaiensis TaxID=442969 RepID=A0A850PDA6_9PROT|nr:ATP-binding cassette domain-containing protein [Ameyamaea chiangmaiensis]MBS4074876.1 ATP-binding cassette domain-containing protein [Ameyamaea chiangmaiensis]NVN40883.1 ATP-binding cassette domain-containing protein [Ameyamaea chiangmaiensis]GBQ63073.1 nitrate/sulfonate/bicarbonate transporter ATP-binding protein [Ameyamaea chiangmaiensis NBRC 103196]
MSVRILDLLRAAPGRARPILDHVSLDIPDGAFVALIGPSGAGKTSLLRVIAGLDAHDGGQVFLDGMRMDQRPARERGVGFVFQNYALFRHMTVADNVAFGLSVLPRRQRPTRAAIAARVEELLALMHLPDLGGAYPHNLSGGQRQRVALARALATGPRLLLLDEPFGALDPMIRKSIRTWLRALHDQLGLTTILVTHDHEEALDVADHLVLMRDGRIEQEGRASDLDRAPCSPFVMAFMGDMARFTGTVCDGLFQPDEAGVLPFALPASDGAAEALIRPHEIVPRAEAGPLALVHGVARGGLTPATARLADRTVDLVLPTALLPAASSGVGLDISAARLFREGVPILLADRSDH